MRKRMRYTDEFRASAVLMLEAAGYPNQKGALMAVSKNLNVPHPTLSRWARKVQNPAPDKLVHEKREELVIRLEDLAHRLLDAIGEDIDDSGVDAVRAATALGITVDKWQLLSGKATENIDQRLLIQYVNDWRTADN